MELDYIIAAGGTGGHVIPAISLKRALEEKNKNVLLISDKRGSRYIKNEDDFKILDVIPFGRSNIFYAVFLFILALIKLSFITIKSKPKSIIIFGGYACLPAVVVAILFRKKLYLHEQNSVMGKMNRIAAKHATKIFLGFENTEKTPCLGSKKTFFTGTPVRKELMLKSETKKRTFPNSLTILIIGGSQGAKIFGEVIPYAIHKMQLSIKQENNGSSKDLTIYQQTTTQAEAAELQDFYKRIEIQSRVAPFFDNIDKLLLDADLVICRSGASTISELVVFSKPSILIPYPHATDDHQLKNANFLVKNNVALLVEQKDLDVDLLAQQLKAITANNSLSKISKRMEKLKINAVENILKELDV